MKPPCVSIAERNTASWAANAARMAFASFSHRRVEPSTSVNRNVTTPEGGPSADTRTGCHTEPSSMGQLRLTFKTCKCRRPGASCRPTVWLVYVGPQSSRSPEVIHEQCNQVPAHTV